MNQTNLEASRTQHRKKLYALLFISSLTLLPTYMLFAKKQEPILFQAEDRSTGKYIAGNKKYNGKAFLDENEYINVVAILKSKLHTKASKKLRKNKDFLGFFIDEKTSQLFYLYGQRKNPEPKDDAPDADVLTVKAIKEDFGIGE